MRYEKVKIFEIKNIQNFSIYNMTKRRRQYGNELTAQIEKGIEIDELLSHSLLSVTVRNEAPVFINYLFPPEEMKKPEPKLPVLEKLIQMSLVPDERQLEKFKLYQLNRNAANIFSSPSSKLHELLREDKSKRYFKSLRKFIFDKNNRNPMFAGHFQRMFEMTLRNSGDILLDKQAYDDNFNETFLPTLIKNSDLLPYRELLSAIMSEFTEYFPDSVDETLRYAAISTLHIDELAEAEQLFNQSGNFVYPTDDLKREKFIQDTQPLNCKKQPLHIPYFIHPSKYKYQPNLMPDDEEFINGLKSDIKYEELQLTDVSHSSEDLDPKFQNTVWTSFALNLIYAVKNAYEMDIDNAMQGKVDQDLREGKDSNVIRYLLICGMYADSNSSLSYTSFSLLFNLLNKPHMDSDGVYDDKYILNLNPPRIVKEYAKHFVFDPYDVTERMISGLLVFWNQHYTNLEKNNEKVVERKTIPGYKSHEGVTPLELLLPTILTEPICSSKLNNVFMRIITSMEQEIIDTINADKKHLQDKNQDDFKNNEHRCFLLDSIWYDLLTYKFKLLPNDKEEITLQKALERLLPLPTTDKFYHTPMLKDEAPQMFRAPTNPVFFMLSNIINHGAFFSYKKGTQFRELFTESFDRDWAIQSFEYYHIIDKMEKNLVSLNYTCGPVNKKINKNFPKIIKTESDDDDDKEIETKIEE